MFSCPTLRFPSRRTSQTRTSSVSTRASDGPRTRMIQIPWCGQWTSRLTSCQPGISRGNWSGWSESFPMASRSVIFRMSSYAPINNEPEPARPWWNGPWSTTPTYDRRYSLPTMKRVSAHSTNRSASPKRMTSGLNHYGRSYKSGANRTKRFPNRNPQRETSTAVLGAQPLVGITVPLTSTATGTSGRCNACANPRPLHSSQGTRVGRLSQPGAR
jgi:hypothetical protein